MPSVALKHWPEYLMEAAGLGLFMVSAGLFGTLLEYPGSPIRQAIDDPLTRRALMGLAMGLTAVVLIYYPWGQQSGAHYNPAVTLAFLRLGKIKPWDAAFYVVAQCVGGVLGVLLVAGILGAGFADPPVVYVATLPGPWGTSAAFTAEMVISGLLMAVVLLTTNFQRTMRFTGLISGLLLFLFITFEAPLSGMSINPARSFASAFPGWLWTAFWVYLLAPPIGMLLAAEAYLRLRGQAGVHCAKLNHVTRRRCIFCGSGMRQQSRPETVKPVLPHGIQQAVQREVRECTTASSM